jgi:hypothetical protein
MRYATSPAFPETWARRKRWRSTFYGLRALSETVAGRIREGGANVNAASFAGFGWRANLERAKNLVGVQGFPDVTTLVSEFGIKDSEGYPISKEALLLWTPFAPRTSLASRPTASASIL